MLRIGIVLLLVCVFGCEKSIFNSGDENSSEAQLDAKPDNAPNKKTKKPAPKHGHRHGIHGGHIFEFDSADFVGEWTQKTKSNLVRIYLLNVEATKEFPVNAESLIVKKGESIFSLDPVSVDNLGQTSVFELDEKELAIAINLGVTVSLFANEKEYSGEIPLASSLHN